MDLSFLRTLMGGDEKLVENFVSIFKHQVPSQINILPGLCVNQEWDELSTTLHSLATQFNYVGLPDFAKQMKEMEESVDSGETDFIDVRIQDFTTEFKRFWQTEFAETDPFS